MKYIRQTWCAMTSGLAVSGRPELKACVNDAALLHEAESFIAAVVDAIVGQELHLEEGEAVAYGYWEPRAFPCQDGSWEFWEHVPDMSQLTPGINTTLEYWLRQHEICHASGATFEAPSCTSLAVVSAGVFEGESTEGVRYPSPEHMSGWWLTTDLYSGNVKDLRVEHLYHITAMRPDLAPLLSLPCGYRFAQSPRSSIWFDPTVIEGSVQMEP